MNNILELKGKRFVQAARRPGSNGASMNSKSYVTTELLTRLEEKLKLIKKFWEEEQKPFNGVLISVHYNKIVAKSNRIAGLFKGSDSNLAIVGAKFNNEKTKHIITYFLDSYDLDRTITFLSLANSTICSLFQDGITKTIFDNDSLFNRINAKTHHISKSSFRQIIADVSYIEDFEVERAPQQFKDSIITLYDTKMDTKLLLVFIVLNIANVIIQTVKSIATVKCGKVSAAVINAVAYGLYTYVIVLTANDSIDLLAKCFIVAGCNFVGVYVVKLIEEKARKDKLWKLELACPIVHHDDLHALLKEYHIPHNYVEAGKWVIFNCYCATQEDTQIVTDLGKKRECKFSAYESKTL